MSAPRKPRGGANLEARLAAVRALREAPDSPQSALAQALGDASNFVVAAAAEVIAERALAELVPDLEVAFDRLMVEPVETDKTCCGKTAIVRALLGLGGESARVFALGTAYVQLEPVFGGKEDTAPELRALCTLGLIRVRHPEATVLAAERLADPSHVTRAGVARVLAELEPGAAVPLLRFKLRLGDTEPQVVAACFAALLELTPAAAVALAAAYLDQHPGAFAEAVALALGESRRREALPVLRDWSERAEDGRRTAYVALALMRDDASFDYLVDVVRAGSAGAAEDALAALAHFRHDDRLAERTLAAARSRKERRLRTIARTAFRRD